MIDQGREVDDVAEISAKLFEWGNIGCLLYCLLLKIGQVLKNEHLLSQSLEKCIDILQYLPNLPYPA